MCLTLEQLGIHPISSRHETGCGQHEIDFTASSALQAADTFLSFKSAVKSIAENHGVHASFMPKPRPDDCGNGMHIGLNLFRDSDFFGDGDAGSTDVTGALRSAAAGIMEHICEFTLLTNPTVNSYDRLGEFSAPRYVAWSAAEEGQLMRINVGESDDRPEAPIILRAPDCVCDPYLVIGLMIYAALEGIDAALELPEPYSPDGSYSLLPSTLEEAAKLAGGSDFLRRYLSGSIVDSLVGAARRSWEEYSAAKDKQSFIDEKYFYSL